MATDRKELESLIARIQSAGATVETNLDNEGRIATIRVMNARGIGSHPMSPLSAAERMREWLHNHETTGYEVCEWRLNGERLGSGPSAAFAKRIALAHSAITGRQCQIRNRETGELRETIRDENGGWELTRWH